jgi:hypothetical protein
MRAPEFAALVEREKEKTMSVLNCHCLKYPEKVSPDYSMSIQ